MDTSGTIEQIIINNGSLIRFIFYLLMGMFATSGLLLLPILFDDWYNRQSDVLKTQITKSTSNKLWLIYFISLGMLCTLWFILEYFNLNDRL